MKRRVSEVRRRRRRELRSLRGAALARRCQEERRRLDEGGCGKAVPAY